MGSLDSLFPIGDYKMFFLFTVKSDFIAEIVVVGSATTIIRDSRKGTKE